MSGDTYKLGDMVIVSRGDWKGYSAVVCQPVEPGQDGHVLLLSDGQIQGVSVSVEDIAIAEQDAQGFAQLASNLIKLGSHVIEKRIIRLI